MPRILVHRDARADIQAIGSQDVAAKIYVFLDEARSSPDLLDTFTAHNFGTSGFDQHHVSRWEEQQFQGRNLWRIKLFALEDEHHYYRIVYAFDPRTHDHYVLGVAKRDLKEPGHFDYTNEHPFTQRVVAVYDNRIRR